MLIFKDLEDKEIIGKFLKEENLNYTYKQNGHYFACLENDKLIGLAKVNIRSERLTLEFLHFRKDSYDLELASALLKSLLFKLESLNYKELFSFEKNDLLDKIGFREGESSYKLVLKDFLTSSCSCGANLDE